ncbi:MAG: DUF370 domain-containing protein [Oscillospiraceae bacterium]|nr:DUF370 domain-containing protein [Oscillospiraceae bacterium]
MYIHLGENISVSEKNVIGIFDLENTTIGQDTRNFLNKREKAGKTVNISKEMPKSFVICEDNGEEKVYVSPIAAATLKKRAKTMF